jgi:type IV pilus assembly protein PilW
MKKNNSTYNRRSSGTGAQHGFTLVELLMAMVMGAIAMGAIYSVYISTTKSYMIQRELAHMQQNLRSAMYLMKNDLRNSGRNGLMNGTVGITNVGRFPSFPSDTASYPGITMTTLVDIDGDGQADADQVQTISYRVFDSDGDGRRELRRLDSMNPTANSWELVFDGIEDIGIAYACDSDNDMDLDRSAASSQIVWAVDTDAQPGLDANVDANGDGTIDASDDSDGSGLINAVDAGLGGQVPLVDIRVVRIWLLARSRVAYNDFIDNSTYVVGNKVVDMSDPVNAGLRNFRHKLLEGAIALQNHLWVP